MKNGQKTLIMILDILLVLSVFYAVFGMVFSKNDAVLVTSGLGAFKYYTVLSNLLCSLTGLVFLIVAVSVLVMDFFRELRRRFHLK